MSPLDWIGNLFGTVDKAVEIGKEATVDADRLLQLAKEGRDAELNAYVAELATKTVPWVDALHKMGRLLTQWGLMAMGTYSMATGKALSEVAWLTIGGPVVVYSIMKGRGR